MKSVYSAVLSLSLLMVASSAKAEKFLGGASGSIESLSCFSTFEGKQKEYVSIARQERDKDGYVDGLQLKAQWFDQSGKQHNALFDVIYVSADDGSILIVGKSPARNAIEL